MFSAIRARLRINSVRARLTFWYLLTLGASLAAFAAFVFVIRARSLYRELDADLEVRAHQFLTDLRPALLGLDVADELTRDQLTDEASLLVRQAPGRVIFRSASFPTLDWAGERQIAAAARSGTALVTVSDRSGTPLRIATLTVDRPGADSLVIQLAASTDPARHILNQLAVAMLLGILVVLGVASYGSSFTARRALAPVDEIVTRARRIQASRLGERLDVHAGSEELDRLVVTLNDMLGRIETSVRSARRFAADASHELQTPIAVMRSAVEAYLRSELQPADYSAMAADLLGEIERLSALVRDLRLLALADAGHLIDSPERVDMASLVEECGEIAQAIAEDKQIRVETRLHDRPAVAGNVLLLRRVLLNLLQNAIRYSPESSRVLVSLDRGEEQAVLTVRDWGCGIAPSALPHIFEAFYRADPARARHTGGTGLGLAIVDQIVRAHGGYIDVTSAPGEGSTFTVSLPLALKPLPT